MANPRRTLRTSPGLQQASVRQTGRARRWVLAGLLVAAALALAWFDGGEKPLRPIAEPVALPEQAQ
jgi:hypothetical protein